MVFAKHLIDPSDAINGADSIAELYYSDDMKGLRDRAILLLGFAGAFRRSELVALDVTDLEFCDGGLRVHIRRTGQLLRRCRDGRLGFRLKGLGYLLAVQA
jgi:site-specific recombinase XerC